MSLVEAVIRSGGYKFDILKHASRGDVETGLKYVNNDACYPAIMVIGQLIDAILEGKYDPDKVCLAITQTGGMCRATNYFGLIRKALIDAGYPQIPVIAISTQGLEDNPAQGDARAAAPHRQGADPRRPAHEVPVPRAPVRGGEGRGEPPVRAVGRDRARGARTPRLLEDGREDPVAQAPLPAVPRARPRDREELRRSAVEGRAAQGARRRGRRDPRQIPAGCEQPCRRRHRIAGLRGRGARHHGVHDHAPVHHRLEREVSRTGGNKTLYALMRWSLDRYNAPIKAAIATSHGKFKQDDPMPELVEKAAEVTSIGVQAGEGWLLTARSSSLSNRDART